MLHALVLVSGIPCGTQHQMEESLITHKLGNNLPSAVFAVPWLTSYLCAFIVCKGPKCKGKGFLMVLSSFFYPSQITHPASKQEIPEDCRGERTVDVRKQKSHKQSYLSLEILQSHTLGWCGDVCGCRKQAARYLFTKSVSGLFAFGLGLRLLSSMSFS